jgi:hypothetical protein
MTDVILSDKILSSSAFARFEKIDIADWLFSLPEAEYQRCCPLDHISCRATFTDAGQRMSINVEMIGRTPDDPALCGGDRNAALLQNGLDLRCVHPKRTHARSGHLDAQRQARR